MKTFAAVTDDHRCTIGDAETLEEAQRMSQKYAPEGVIVTHVFEITEEEARDWEMCSMLKHLLGFTVQAPVICERCPVHLERVKNEAN